MKLTQNISNIPNESVDRRKLGSLNSILEVVLGLIWNVYIVYFSIYQVSGSNFRAFWLAPVTRNILEYSLFCEPREKWRVVSRKF